MIYVERSSGKTLSHEEFWQMKEELALTQGYGIKNLKRNKDANVDEERTIHEKENISNEPPAVVCGSHNFMSTFIQDRYRSILENTVNTLLFIIVKSDKGIEMSGHIDLNQRFTDDPNFQKYLKGTSLLVPHHGDLTFHHWNKGKTILGNSDNWEIITETGKAQLRNKHSGQEVKMDILQLQGHSFDEGKSKKRSKNELKARKSSSRWSEIDTGPDSGIRIMYWDLYLTKSISA